jgi:hypothetical protein
MLPWITVEISCTKLKIMVSPVRIRVPPLKKPAKPEKVGVYDDGAGASW